MARAVADEQRDVIDGQRLAYMDEVPVNWCPALGTVLANEEVIDGKSEVGGFPVETPAAAAVDAAHHRVRRAAGGRSGAADWPESLKEMQRNWIGQSVGAEVDFEIVPLGRSDVDARAAAATSTETTMTWRSPSSRRGRTRCSARRTWCWRRSIRWSIASPPPTQRETVEAYRTQVAAQERPRSQAETQGQDRRLHRRVRDQSGERREDPDLDRRLRADGLRHRRDHGRAGAR